MKAIKIGDQIAVDKGRLGLDFGTLQSIDGCSMGSFFGTYETGGKNGLEIKSFDQSVHKISLYEAELRAKLEEVKAEKNIIDETINKRQ